MRIEQSPKNMRGLRLVGGGENGRVSTPFGPVKAGLTTTHRTQSQALSESLNYLEREIQTLESRYLEVCATLTDVLARLVEQKLFGINISTTEEDSVR